MEPITLGFLLVAAMSGVVGNKADKAIDLAIGKTLQAFTNRHQPGDESVYSELQKATCRSFLLAQQSIASECLKELTTGRMQFDYAVLPGHEADFGWLQQKLKRVEKELKQVEQGKVVDVPIALGEIQPLLTPEGALAVNSMQAVREKLIAAVRDQGTVPYYQSKVEDSQAGLFEQMRRHFAAEILHNAVLNNFFQGQLLTQINANLQELQAQQINVGDWENSLRDLAQKVPQDIEEIKGLLKQIADSQVRQMAVPLQFQSLIADKTDGFVGRQFVFDAIAQFLQQPNGYFIIEADPGVGKSAILAEYVQRTGCVAHFNVRSQGITRTEQFLQSVCTQLIERYGLHYPIPIPAENTSDGNFLARLLNEIVGANDRLPLPGGRLVIAVDALDEVDLNSQTAGANVLYLPASLPNGVYFIVTKRPTPLPLVVNKQQIFDLMQYQAESLEDVQTYIRQRVTDVGANGCSPLQEWIRSRGLTVEEFVTTLGEKSDRNFMYLRYVLPEIESGAYQDLNKIENLPQGLEQYYYQHWQHMGMTAKPLPRTKIKIVYVLAEALQPVSCNLISELAGEDVLTVQEVLDDWEQFLREQRIDGQTRYSIYHASFQDFLHRKEIVQKAGETIEGVNARIVDSLTQGLFDDE